MIDNRVVDEGVRVDASYLDGKDVAILRYGVITEVTLATQAGRKLTGFRLRRARATKSKRAVHRLLDPPELGL